MAAVGSPIAGSGGRTVVRSIRASEGEDEEALL